MPIYEKIVSELTAVEIIAYTVVSVVIAQLWLRVFTNLFINSMGLSSTSWWAMLVLSLGATFLFLYYAISYPATLVGFL